MSLTNQTQRTALVTGSTRGIGKETTLLLLKKGLNVIISSRSQQSVDNVIEEILDKFPSKKENILGLKCDVSKHSEVKTLVDISKKIRKVDVLVNNAGIVYFKCLLDTTEEEWDKAIDTNLKGVFLFTKEVLPYMIENKLVLLLLLVLELESMVSQTYLHIVQVNLM
jgi:NAD(P)-dependent dehydrogenase (short-subunit alcohol dehydrogenase family)